MSYDAKINEIMSLLLRNNDWVNASELSDILKLSKRSVINYISAINQQHGNCIMSSNKGYRLSNPSAFFSLVIDERPCNYEERKNYILCKALLTNETITLDGLCDYFFVSHVTLQNEIAKLRKELKSVNLYIKLKNDRLFVIGDQKAKRNYAVSLINEELEKSHFDINKIQLLFTSINLNHIKAMILNVLKKYNYFLDDYSLINYVIHIAVNIELKQISQLKDPPSPKEESYMNIIATPHVINIVNEIYDDLKEVYNIEFTANEIFEASMLMMTRVVSEEFNKINVAQLDKIVGPKITELLSEIIVSVRNCYGIDLKQDNFMIRFAIHIKNLFIRLDNNISIKNVQFKFIKENFPFIYVVAVYIATIIKRKTGYILSEDEIADSALHIGVLIEEQQSSKGKICCAVFSLEYNFIEKNIIEKLKNSFSDILVLGITDSYDDIKNFTTIDFIISTIDLYPQCKLPCVLISPFITQNDIKIISNMIETVKKEKEKKLILERIKYFFRQDLCFLNCDFKSSTDVIETLCDSMLEKGLVSNDYKNEIYMHEEISSSSYGNIAIPHPLNNKAISSVIALVISKKPIDWKGNDVNLIFMLSFKEEDKVLFQETFNYITELISIHSVWEKIICCSNYQELLSILVSSK